MPNQKPEARPIHQVNERFARQAAPEEFVKYVTTRPHNAHPELPVHLERVFYVRPNGLGSAFPTGQREWVSSYPSQELADARASFLVNQNKS